MGKEKSAAYSRKYAHANRDKIAAKKRREYANNKEKFIVRTKTNQENEKLGYCSDCGIVGKTEFHHLSYKPNIFLELCIPCHNARHGRKSHVIKR